MKKGSYDEKGVRSLFVPSTSPGVTLQRFDVAEIRFLEVLMVTISSFTSMGRDELDTGAFSGNILGYGRITMKKGSGLFFVRPHHLV